MQCPDFELIDPLKNETYRLSNIVGKPIILTFWVSWCADCQRDLPKKAAFYNSVDKDTLHFLSINVTGREAQPEDGLKFAKEHQLPFPVLSDNGRQTYDAFGCRSVPTTLLIDSQGRIAAVFGDKASFTEIIQALSTLLND